MGVIDVVCPHCESMDGVVKNGKADSGLQRYLCKCSFQLDFVYNANKAGTHERIKDMAMNGLGVRDMDRVLGISPTIIISHLKNWCRRM
ncbi:IS1 family transposase [Kistimonas asteriae]|uniref:IS1 family transposase n=1 Tax=Kistimonas asteriae TaxID=517724 RepID=UPI001BA697EC